MFPKVVVMHRKNICILEYINYSLRLDQVLPVSPIVATAASSTLNILLTMKGFSIVLSSIFFALIVLAGPLSIVDSQNQLHQVQKRDLTTIWSILNIITDDLNKMNKTIEVFDGDPLKAVPILDAAAITLKDLKMGFDKVNATDELNLITSAVILYPVYYLYYAVDGVTSQLVAKKDLFDKASVLFVVQDELQAFKKTAGDLITATLSKIPWYLGIISGPIGNSIKGMLDTAAKAYGV
jgi:Hydrophobic surface binding protein A